MAEPRIDWQGQKLYLNDTDGSVWRVYDCAIVGHRSRAVPLSDPRAVHRAFVSRDGTRRILHFAKATSRAINPTLLMQQLRASELAPGDRLPSDGEPEATRSAS